MWPLNWEKRLGMQLIKTNYYDYHHIIFHPATRAEREQKNKFYGVVEDPFWYHAHFY